MKLLKLLSFSWWITTAKRKLPLPWDVKLDGSSAVMRSRKIMSSSRPGQQHCHANARFCPHLENITPPVLFPLPSAQPPSPPFYCWIALLSHTHPYILISHFHTNLPDKLSPLQHSLSQTCPQPPKKQFILYMWGQKDITPGQKSASCQGGQVPGPHHSKRQQPQPTHLQSQSNVSSALWKLCLLKSHPYVPLFFLFHTLC